MYREALLITNVLCVVVLFRELLSINLLKSNRNFKGKQALRVENLFPFSQSLSNDCWKCSVNCHYGYSLFSFKTNQLQSAYNGELQDKKKNNSLIFELNAQLSMKRLTFVRNGPMYLVLHFMINVLSVLGHSAFCARNAACHEKWRSHSKNLGYRFVLPTLDAAVALFSISARSLGKRRQKWIFENFVANGFSTGSNNQTDMPDQVSLYLRNSIAMQRIGLPVFLYRGQRGFFLTIL